MADIPYWFHGALLHALQRGNSLILTPQQVDDLVQSLKLQPIPDPKHPADEGEANG